MAGVGFYPSIVLAVAVVFAAVSFFYGVCCCCKCNGRGKEEVRRWSNGREKLE
jgi:hypothetical protein